MFGYAPSEIMQNRGNLGFMTAEGFFDPGQPVFKRRGNLPHWRQDGVIYFVTFRLSDSLPRSVLDRWRDELIEWQRANPDADDEEIERYMLQRRRRLEKWLDRGFGSCVLKISSAKEIVEQSLHHFDGERYELLSSTVAPNHVHLLVRPGFDVDLSRITYSWKRFTASRLKQLPEVMARWQGSPRHLWQTESFDHIVRNQRSFERIGQYIRSHER